MSIRRRSERALLACLLALAPVAAATHARAQDDPQTVADRELFKRGMDSYNAGAIRDAIEIWRPIYDRLGGAKGYRLSFNLGIALQELGDATQAAERYESFLHEVQERRARNELVEPRVAKEEGDARARLAGLMSTFGRIRVAPRRAADTRIDAGEPRAGAFVAFVAPGRHTVSFAGVATPVEVDVGAGHVVDATPPPEEPAQLPPPARVVEPPRLVAPPPLATTRVMREVHRPFPAGVLYAAAGLTIASAVLPIVLYNQAASLKQDHDASSDAAFRRSIEGDYETARTTAYITLAIPISLAATTTALTAWYLLGRTERDVVVPLPFIAPTQSGGVAGFRARF